MATTDIAREGDDDDVLARPLIIDDAGLPASGRSTTSPQRRLELEGLNEKYAFSEVVRAWKSTVLEVTRYTSRCSQTLAATSTSAYGVTQRVRLPDPWNGLHGQRFPGE
jgi:hypothetical protein